MADQLSGETLHTLAAHLTSAIDKFCVDDHAAHEDGKRWHLGASVIGAECLRQTWYGYRWYAKEQLTGRKVRLFERGHNTELRFAAWLRAVGLELKTHNTETGEQYRYSAVHGHYGGSFDGVGYWEPLKVHLLVECKTHNTKSFVNLKNVGLFKAKPVHYKQMCAYGKAFGLEYGIYIALNKNDDDLYIEVVKLSWEQGDELELRAESIITTRVPPQRISPRATDFACKHCTFVDICHYKGVPDKHCRSCENAYPTEGGEWYCALWASNIPRDVAKAGCASYKVLNSAAT